MSTFDRYLRVWVVTTYTNATGGFQWYFSEGEAQAFYESERAYADERPDQTYEVHWVGDVVVPDDVEASEITEWLDANGELWERPRQEA